MQIVNRIKKITLVIPLLSVFCMFAQTQKPPSTCVNLDFSLGDFTGWVGRTSIYPNNWPDATNCSAANNVFVTCPNGSGFSCNGCYSLSGQPTGGSFGYVPFYDTPGIVNGRHTIISTSVPDPYACNTVMTLPPGEPFCTRLGNGGNGPWGNGVGYQIDYLSYTLTVGTNNSLLTYKYAVILQDPLRDPNNPPHSVNIRPRFNAYIKDANNKLIDQTCGKFEVVYDTTLVGFRECPLAQVQGFGGNPLAQVGTAYRAWTTVGVDLRKFIGQTVTLEFNTWDCGWGGHFGYAYVSARCDSFALLTESCDGTVLVTAPDGFSYKWFPGGQTTRSIKVFNANPGDSAYVELTTENGCKTSLSTKVYPILANADFTANPTIVCLGKPIAFRDTSTSYFTLNNKSIPIVNWKWSFGDGTGSTIPYPSHNYSAAGNYTVSLVITNAKGCIDSLQKVVQVYASPTANFSTNDICANNTAAFIDLSQVTGTTPQYISDWTWTFKDNNTTSNLQNSSHLYTISGTYTVNLSVKTNKGCVDDTSKTIKIWPFPLAAFTAADVCIGDTVVFINQSLKGDPADNIVNHIWSFADTSALSSDKDPTHVYLKAGTYKVLLIVSTARGCVDDTVIDVTVHPTPLASFTAGSVCKDNPLTFQDMSTPDSIIVNWNWNFGDDNNNTSSLQNPTHLYDSSRVYYPKLIVTSKFSCIDSFILPVNVLPLPEVSFDANKYEGCSPLCVVFKDLSYSGADSIRTWDWTFGDGNVSTLKDPPHCYTEPGTYTVSLSIETTKGCKHSYTWPAMIRVYPHPIADFVARPYETNETAPLIEFFEKSSGADFWRWDFGDNEGVLAKDTSHVYKKSGVFTVWLYVSNQYNCVDSISKDIVINPEWTFYVPNAFSPNSNGINDGFTGYGVNIREFDMWIFDRWGLMIYHTADQNAPWNGMVNNGANGQTAAQQDVYVWKISLKDVFDKRHDYIGHVTLVR